MMTSSVSPFWKLVERWRATFIVTVPTAAAALMQRPSATLSVEPVSMTAGRPARVAARTNRMPAA